MAVEDNGGIFIPSVHAFCIVGFRQALTSMRMKDQPSKSSHASPACQEVCWALRRLQHHIKSSLGRQGVFNSNQGERGQKPRGSPGKVELTKGHKGKDQAGTGRVRGSSKLPNKSSTSYTLTHTQVCAHLTQRDNSNL